MNYGHITIEELLEIIESRLTPDPLSMTISEMDAEIKRAERDLMRRDALEGTTFRTAAMLEHRKAVAEAEMQGFREGMGL